MIVIGSLPNLLSLRTNRLDSLVSRCSVKEQRVDGILQSSIG